MWLRLLYVVSTVEAALLAAILVVVVVEPGVVGFAVSPRARQLCAVGALVLGVGCAVAVYSWLQACVSGRSWLDL
jgi:hypothetical protein